MEERLKFIHEFDLDPANGDLSVETDRGEEQHIKISVEDGQEVWISANKAGWLHLAKICAELGTRDLEAGYHFHKNFDFKWSSGDEPEISFEVIE